MRLNVNFESRVLRPEKIKQGKRKVDFASREYRRPVYYRYAQVMRTCFPREKRTVSELRRGKNAEPEIDKRNSVAFKLDCKEGDEMPEEKGLHWGNWRKGKLIVA